jgi:pimeloyl-ACP methyl ester carboxylesterase
MPFYQSNDVHLSYISRRAPGNGARNSIVFQHGIGGDVLQPSRFLMPERLGIPAGALNIFHADFRGHGQSELGPVGNLSVATLGCDLAVFLDHLQLDDAIVGGISMGAAAALRLAVQHPARCRALILSRPAWAAGQMNARARLALALVADLLAADDWRSSAFRALEQSGTLQSLEAVCPDAAKSLRGQVKCVLSSPEIRDSAIARLRHLPSSRGLEDDGASLAVVRCPTLILATEGDPTHPFECARFLAEHLPNCRLERIGLKSALDDKPHLEEVDQKIGEFLRSQPGFTYCSSHSA